MKLGTKPTVREGNFLYLILGIILLSIGGFVQKRDLWSGLLISQYGLILLPPLVFLRVKNYSLKENLRLNSTSLKNILLTISIVIFTYPIAVFFNFIGISFLERFGRTVGNALPLASNRKELVLQLLIVAGSPAICEEIMFRGFLMSSYENLGRKKAILYSALLFGVFHFNLQNLLGPTVLGIVFGIMVVKTNSILVSMVGHLVNNALAVFLGYLMASSNLADLAASSEGGSLEASASSPLPAICILGGISILSMIVVFKLIGQMDEGEDQGGEKLIEINNDNVLLIREVEDIDLITVLPILLILAIYFLFNYRIFFS